MRILIVEDEPIHADRFEMLALQMGYEVAGICDNAFDALDCFHRTQPDLLLLDIHLRGDTDGVQLAERLRQSRAVPVIFITSMQDDDTFARARRTGPAAFILKPFDLLQLRRAIELAVGSLAPAPNDFEQTDLVLPDCLFIKVREKLEKVPLDDILYVESEGRYAMLHTVAGRKFAIRIPLGDLEARLPADRFARIHRGYLIHLKWMQSVDLHDMTVKVKDRDLPLGKSYREQVLERLQQL
jgi:DNA-binding LytR/AlgR family response regulator